MIPKMKQIVLKFRKLWGLKNFNENFNICVDAYANANANADAGGSTIALGERCSGELKMVENLSSVFHSP